MYRIAHYECKKKKKQKIKNKFHLYRVKWGKTSLFIESS